ncbi:MAG: hypothetical protein LWW99_10865, partial [Deltaproteobacteria bacterium]|nr:hypothetical protein [Deltaproteobacteria bacterium]
STYSLRKDDRSLPSEGSKEPPVLRHKIRLSLYEISSLGITTLDLDGDDVDDDWFAEFAEVIVINQNDDGYWTGCYWGDPILCTEWALLTLERVVPNISPDCSKAYASIQEIWPPNHKYVDIEIMGVTDPDGDPVTIAITGITQDEPVDAIGNGDGKTSPDGAGVGTSTASVRAERQGKGNGRVYEISFTATDPAGAECSRSVTVCVPHDQRPGHECIDDGQIYDSTVEE